MAEFEAGELISKELGASSCNRDCAGLVALPGDCEPIPRADLVEASPVKVARSMQGLVLTIPKGLARVRHGEDGLVHATSFDARSSGDGAAGTRADASLARVIVAKWLVRLVLMMPPGPGLARQGEPGRSACACMDGSFDGDGHPPLILGESKPRHKSLRTTTSRSERWRDGLTPCENSSSIGPKPSVSAMPMFPASPLPLPRVRRRRRARRVRPDGELGSSSSAVSPSCVTLVSAALLDLPWFVPREASDGAAKAASASASTAAGRGDIPPCEDPTSDKDASVVAVEEVVEEESEDDFKFTRAE